LFSVGWKMVDENPRGAAVPVGVDGRLPVFGERRGDLDPQRGVGVDDAGADSSAGGAGNDKNSGIHFSLLWPSSRRTGFGLSAYFNTGDPWETGSGREHTGCRMTGCKPEDEYWLSTQVLWPEGLR
jgi:hypothetical protein